MGKHKSDRPGLSLVGNGKTKHAVVSAGGANRTVGVLSFEVATLMAKTCALWRLLDDAHVVALRDELLRYVGVRKLVSDDDGFLLALAVSEVSHSLSSLSQSVVLLSRRCSLPSLLRFPLVLSSFLSSPGTRGGDDDEILEDFRLSSRKMDRKVKKMDRLVAATSSLYKELHVLAELELSLQRAQSTLHSAAGVSVAELAQKVAWQRQEVKYLRESSIWSRSYDFAIRLLARSLFTIVARIRNVFAFDTRKFADASPELPGRISYRRPDGFGYNGIPRLPSPSINAGSSPYPTKNRSIKMKWPMAGIIFKGCRSSHAESPIKYTTILKDAGIRASFAESTISTVGGNFAIPDIAATMFGLEYKYPNAPESTLGAAALALHYANVIILIEKLASSPHLIGEDARDDLYTMLPASIRAALRVKLKSYAKNLGASVFDPALAAKWSEAIARILEWLAPLAHNMIKWHSERNFEQRSVIPSTSVLLLQTLYYANQTKTEAAITELLIGLNYLWRFGKELNARALLECAGDDDRLDSSTR